MCMLAKLGGYFALVPATILLTVSFFVLFALQKTLPDKLKAFGFIVVLLLWASAAMILGAGIYGSKAGLKCSMMKMMQSEMSGQNKALSAPMHGGMQNTQK